MKTTVHKILQTILHVRHKIWKLVYFAHRTWLDFVNSLESTACSRSILVFVNRVFCICELYICTCTQGSHLQQPHTTLPNWSINTLLQLQEACILWEKKNSWTHFNNNAQNAQKYCAQRYKTQKYPCEIHIVLLFNLSTWQYHICLDSNLHNTYIFLL